MAFGLTRLLNLLSGATASAAPTLTDGTLGRAVPFSADQGVVLVSDTAGTGDLTADVVLWGWVTEKARWFSLGALTDAPLAEVATDALNAAIGIAGLRAFDRLYCQIIALGGTGTAVDVDILLTRSSPVTTS